MKNYVCTFRHVYPVCNYRGNFRKNGPINDDDSRQSQKCGVCVDIKGHHLHATGGNPQQSYTTANISDNNYLVMNGFVFKLIVYPYLVIW
jgi:hypothetical protein